MEMFKKQNVGKNIQSNGFLSGTNISIGSDSGSFNVHTPFLQLINGLTTGGIMVYVTLLYFLDKLFLLNGAVM